MTDARVAPLLLLLALVVTAGCGHGEPWLAPDPHPAGPFQPGQVARLTLNPGRDLSAVWSTEGILYTWENVDAVGRPWCLGRLPLDGGSRTRSWCGAVVDSLIAFDQAVEGPGGRFAYTRTSNVAFARSPVTWWVMVSPDGAPSSGVAVSPVVFGASSLTFQGAEQLAWLDSLHIVWVGARRVVGAPCRACPDDTVQSGRALILLDLRQPMAPVVLPGTDYATSVAVRSDDEVLFTRGGDSRVYRLVVSTGMRTPLWDFAAAGVIRDIQLRGDTLVGVIGGQVLFAWDPVFQDTIQTDGGGDVVLLELATGQQRIVSAGNPVRHPALSPDGRRLLVQTASQPEDVLLVTVP